MAPRISWSKLLPGLIAIAVLVFVTVGVLMYAGIGQIRGEKMHLFVLADQARGVMHGTEVWISGQKVGLVDGVEFRAPSSDSLGRLVVAISVKGGDAGQIRKDSRAQVRSGATLISPVIVDISSGSPQSPRVQDGDTIRARAQSDFAAASVKLTDVAAQLAPAMSDARVIVANLHSPSGTVGAALTEGVSRNAARLGAQVSRLRARMAGSSDPSRTGPATVMNRARIAMARADSIRTLLASTNSSFGRFRRDSTLGKTVASVHDELTQLRVQLARNDGTLGRFSSDSALMRSIADAQREMALLFADIRRRPMHYVYF